MISRFIIFLLFNFGALALGGLFTRKGVRSEWYLNLNKAPWTPPGWFFGFAWTTIMICFSIYMTVLWPLIENKSLLMIVFVIQWILNVAWNPIFFYFHKKGYALVVIVLLTILIGFLIRATWPIMKPGTLLLFPYFIWLIVATSLNGYIVRKN